jgi:hypothetical protein
MKIAKTVGPLIDKLANNIFMSYREILLDKPIDYIVPAIWGAKKNGGIDKTQKEINQQVVPVVKGIFNLLHVNDLSSSQEYAIGYLSLED